MMDTTYIRIAHGLTILASDIAAYLPWPDTADADEMPLITNGWSLGPSHTLIKTLSGDWYASTLTPRELDNRIRKAGATIL